MQSWRQISPMSPLLLGSIVHLREAKDCTDQVSYVILWYMKTQQSCHKIDTVLKYFSKLLRATPSLQKLIYNLLFVSIAINSHRKQCFWLWLSIRGKQKIISLIQFPSNTHNLIFINFSHFSSILCVHPQLQTSRSLPGIVTKVFLKVNEGPAYAVTANPDTMDDLKFLDIWSPLR